MADDATSNGSILSDDFSDDEVIPTTNSDDDGLEDEKHAVKEEDSDMPEGLAHSDPGIVRDDWEAHEIHRGVGDNEDEDDVEDLGFTIEDGDSKTNQIDTFGDGADV